jgi:UDP-2,3-diacylglucosamine pyrophosphatase LpxH
MKVALITDTHFGFKKGNQDYHDFFLKFYNDIFFPTLKKKKIKHVIHLGDVFDIRRNIDFWSLNWARKNIFNPLEEKGITMDMMVGNHDAFYKNTLEINSLEALLLEYSNLNVYSEPSEVILDGRKVVYLPWICDQNEEQSVNILRDTDAEVVLGHLEMQGFKTNPTYICNHGRNTNEFDKFELVMSGHFHTKSKKGNFKYLGNSYQMYWNDYGDQRGFYIFDTETLKLQYIKNPYEMFHKIFYDDTKNDYYDLDVDKYKNTVVKVVVENKTDYTGFDYLINSLQDVTLDLKIIEDFSTEESEDEDIQLEHEDTLTILEKYIEELNTNLDSGKLKEIMKSLYVEALEVV